jgi:TPR repeat protein
LAIEQGMGGLSPDPEKAIGWWEQAAAQGFEPAKEALQHLAASGLYPVPPKAS